DRVDGAGRRALAGRESDVELPDSLARAVEPLRDQGEEAIATLLLLEARDRGGDGVGLGGGEGGDLRPEDGQRGLANARDWYEIPGSPGGLRGTHELHQGAVPGCRAPATVEAATVLVEAVGVSLDVLDRVGLGDLLE